MDPLAADYAAWSPYNYVMGNPIRLVDPDGRSVDDIIVNGQKYIPGASPANGSSHFVKETFNALNQIVSGSDKNAANLVIGLANNQDIEVDIVQSQSATEARVGIGEIGGKHVIRRFQTVEFDADRGLEETATGKAISPDVALVHELGHIQNAIDSPTDFDRRSKTPDPNWGDLEEKEVINKYEIPYAASRGMLQRTGYSKGYSSIKTINSTNAITPSQLNSIIHSIMGSF